MKVKLTTFGIISIILFSCSVQKRIYRKGFYTCENRLFVNDASDKTTNISAKNTKNLVSITENSSNQIDSKPIFLQQNSEDKRVGLEVKTNPSLHSNTPKNAVHKFSNQFKINSTLLKKQKTIIKFNHKTKLKSPPSADASTIGFILLFVGCLLMVVSVMLLLANGNFLSWLLIVGVALVIIGWPLSLLL